MLRIAQRTATGIDLQRELAEDDIELDERCHGGTYGIADDATARAMELAARTEGMVTDPVCKGESMAVVIDLVRRKEIDTDATVLFAHLGGQPPLNGYSALFSWDGLSSVLRATAVLVSRTPRPPEGPL